LSKKNNNSNYKNEEFDPINDHTYFYCYIELRKNMTEIRKFVYTMIIFLSSLLLELKAVSQYFFFSFSNFLLLTYTQRFIPYY